PSGASRGHPASAFSDAPGMTSVLIHPLAGVLAAYGIGQADVIAMRETAVETPLRDSLAERLPATVLRPLEESARAELAAQGADSDTVQVTRRAHLRYDGTDTPLAVPWGSAREMTTAFESAYRRRFAFLIPDKQIVVEAASVAAAAPSHPRWAEPDECGTHTAVTGSVSHSSGGEPSGAEPAEADEYVRMFAAGEWARVPLLRRAALRAGQAGDGPAVIAEDPATTVVEPGWRASVAGRLGLLLTPGAPAPRARPAPP